MASNEHVNKVELADGTTLVDLTSDTVTASDMVRGVTAHDRSGATVTGTMDISGSITDSTVDSVLADGAPTGTDSLRTSQLSRFWAGIKSWAAGVFYPKSGGTVNGSVSSTGEVSATETVTVDGTSTTRTHNLTDKLDEADYRASYTWGEAKQKFTWGSIKGLNNTTGTTQTENLLLVKPGYGSTVDISAMNGNMDILDSTVNGKVSKSGDTMTGDLTVSKPWAYITAKNSDVSLSTSSDNGVVSEDLAHGLVCHDNNGQWTGLFRSYAMKSGRVRSQMAARNMKADGNYVENHFFVGVNKDGTKVYECSDASKFRSDLGITPANIGAVALNGNSTIDGCLFIKRSHMDRDGANPSQILYGENIRFLDKDEERMADLRVIHETNGRNWLNIQIYNENLAGTTQYSSAFNMYLARDGTQTYSVDNPTNFRSAIGAAASSDRRLKTDISELSDDACGFVDSLKPCVYTINGKRQVGLIAQDVHESDIWGTDMAFETVEGIDGLDDWEKMEDGSPTWKLDYIRIIPPLVAALKDARARIAELESEIKNLRK